MYYLNFIFLTYSSFTHLLVHRFFTKWTNHSLASLLSAFSFHCAAPILSQLPWPCKKSSDLTPNKLSRSSVLSKNNSTKKPSETFLRPLWRITWLQSKSTDKFSARSLQPRFGQTFEISWLRLFSPSLVTFSLIQEMNTLSESFGAEIRHFPDNYFLTFEMYDLLHDW